MKIGLMIFILLISTFLNLKLNDFKFNEPIHNEFSSNSIAEQNSDEEGLNLVDKKEIHIEMIITNYSDQPKSAFENERPIWKPPVNS